MKVTSGKLNSAVGLPSAPYGAGVIISIIFSWNLEVSAPREQLIFRVSHRLVARVVRESHHRVFVLKLTTEKE